LAVGSSDRETEAKAYAQAAYIGILERAFTWGKKSTPGVINTVAEITTGTVTLTTASTAGTFSSAPAASCAGRKIVTDQDGIVCRISTHTAAAAAFTLDSAYQGDGGSGLTFSVFQDEYSLASDFLVPRNKTRFLRDCHGNYDMDLIDADELDARFPYRASSGAAARYCAIIRHQKIRIYPWMTDAHRYEYEYCYHPGVLTFDGVAGTDTPIIQPAEDRVAIAFLAIANLLVDKNDDRAAAHVQAAQAKIADMKRLDGKTKKHRTWMRTQFAVGTMR
jgi:hypothetical protein